MNGFPQSWSARELEGVAAALRLLEGVRDHLGAERPITVGDQVVGHAVWSEADYQWRFVPDSLYAPRA